MASHNIYLPQWGHLGNGSQFMRNLDKHLRKEVALEQHQKKDRDEMARRANRALGKGKMEGLGQHIGSIPAREYFRSMQVHGHDCWTDKQYVREYFRDNPDYRAQS